MNSSDAVLESRLAAGLHRLADGMQTRPPDSKAASDPQRSARQPGLRRPIVLALLALVVAVTGAGLVGSWLDDEADVSSSTAPVMPDMNGMTLEQAYELLVSEGLLEGRTVEAGTYLVRSIANEAVTPDVVFEQSPAADSPISPDVPIVLTVSAGGPVSTYDRLPEAAQALVEDRPEFDPDEPILVVNTPNGTAYKTDGLLFGPCSAVDAAYRTFADGRYDDDCY
jgi:hypothetical protein